ncbi:MAG: flagellar biosynthesis protein FlhB [Limnobacter sp.]|nr:flagellar biosynthesis protein FlhB [Limnobacter sp.]
MAQEDDQERDLAASEQKIRKAREDGNVPRSRELAGGVVLLGGISLMYLSGSHLIGEYEGLLRAGLTLDRQQAFDTKSMGIAWIDMLQHSFIILLPLFVMVYVAAILANVGIGGLNWSTKPLEPKFSKLNPLKGLKNMFSVHGLAELVKAILKTVVLGIAGYFLLMSDIDKFPQLGAKPLEAGMIQTARIVIYDALILSVVYLFVVALDVPYQLWKYYKELRMNLEELKRESKESEGDPHLKGKIRAMQREAARKRMMAAVPTADVVVTNPTELAIAIRYDYQTMAAPIHTVLEALEHQAARRGGSPG